MAATTHQFPKAEGPSRSPSLRGSVLPFQSRLAGTGGTAAAGNNGGPRALYPFSPSSAAHQIGIAGNPRSWHCRGRR